MKILIEISYKGTNYCGWQMQKNGISIQEVLQTALSSFFNENILLVASGRTDAGVHANKQYAHFTLEKKFDLSKLPIALEHLLPQDISITNAVKVEDDFHARYSAICKTYYYRVYFSKVKLPLKDDFMLQVKKDLNLDKIKKGCSYFVGKHNFKAFCVPRKLVDENFERTIFSCQVEKNNNEFLFKICGDGFLHNMVRIIVGTLIDVGTEKIEPESIKKIILEKDRAKAGKTVSAKGLTLQSVSYGEAIDNLLNN